MRHNYSKFISLLITLLLLLTPMAQAQDEPSPYDIALQRIDEADGYLFLSDLGLAAIPKEVFQLTNLRGLEFANNQLRELPPEIGQLTTLIGLDLSGNQLSELPSEFWQLTNLQTLNLRNNQLQELPPELGQLTELISLDLRNNQLSYLPEALVNLPYLGQCLDCGLFVEGNPLVSPPSDIIQQGTFTIFSYLREEHARQQAERQQLILGATGGVGMLALLILGFRLKQRSQRKEKPKRDAA